jgi:hypothetical protein
MIGERRVVVTRRVVWSLPSPCNWIDVLHVTARAKQELGEAAMWDDAVSIEASEDEIHISYDEPETPA